MPPSFRRHYCGRIYPRRAVLSILPAVLLEGHAAKIDDVELRRTFLENVTASREIVEEYAKLG